MRLDDFNVSSIKTANIYTLLDCPGQLPEGQIQLLLEAYHKNFQPEEGLRKW